MWLPTRAEKTALIWEGEDGAVRELTYRQLLEETDRIANALIRLGVVQGTGSVCSSR